MYSKKIFKLKKNITTKDKGIEILLKIIKTNSLITPMIVKEKLKEKNIELENVIIKK